jgi:hypothetical protein
MKIRIDDPNFQGFEASAGMAGLHERTHLPDRHKNYRVAVGAGSVAVD